MYEANTWIKIFALHVVDSSLSPTTASGTPRTDKSESTLITEPEINLEYYQVWSLPLPTNLLLKNKEQTSKQKHIHIVIEILGLLIMLYIPPHFYQCSMASPILFSHVRSVI